MERTDAVAELHYPIPNPTPLAPPPEWEELRQRCPVAPVTLPSGGSAVLVTRYADPSPPAELATDVRHAIAVCPAQAITAEE